jgi:hypothetical protein
MKKVVKWQAADGKLFDNEKSCEKYCIDKVCEFVDKRAHAADNKHILEREQFKIVLELVGDTKKIQELRNMLLAWFPYYDQDDSDIDD